QASPSEDPTHNTRPNRCPGPKNSRITQFLPKLLPTLLQLAMAATGTTTVATAAALRNVQRHIPIVRRWRRLRRHRLLLDPHVATWEDAFLARSFATALPPFRVHVLCDCDAVVGLEVQIAGVCGSVGV